MTADGPSPVSTDALFAGKTAVVFGLPGAFTPTCSAQHVPGYVDNAAALTAKGIDMIACISVNDAFVMDAWGRSLGVGDSVAMVADGNAEFTTAAGLAMDLTQRGMGVRSRRYAMIVRDGIVDEIHVEGPGEFAVSDAATMLSRL